MKSATLLTTLLLFAALAGCGGGNTQTADGGIGGTGVTQGKVSGYGSIFVNGVEFDTDTAAFVIEEVEDSSFSQDDIKLGMVVRVTGEQDGVSGTATAVSYSSQLEGVITVNRLDPDGVGTLEVMRQTVHVDQTTVYDDAGLGVPITALAVNHVVEVSGFSDGLGAIYATRIELKSQDWADETLEIKGVVTNLDPTNETFDIGSLKIDYSGATLHDGPPQTDWYVEVDGNSFTDDQFLATSVELEGDGDLLVADDGEEVELEGVVTSPLLDNLFSLNGQPVSIANLTIDGTEIVEGRELEVEGTLVDGILEASEIEFDAVESAQQEMATSVEAVDVVDLNTGTLTLFGQTISVNSSTLMEDELGDDQLFNFAEILQGNYVKVDLYDDGSGLVALKVTRESPPDPMEHEIEGLVEAIDLDNSWIWVLGVKIDIAATGITPAEGDRVDISGESYEGDTLTATSGEIEE